MERVLILGATSAIAAEVAKIHAARGDRVHLVARNPSKLLALTTVVGGTAVTHDVADLSELDSLEAGVASWVERMDGLDRVLVAHGDLGDQMATETSWMEAARVLQVNLMSPIALLIPLSNRMRDQGWGKIGVITSVAGERGRPRNYTYGTAKGALSTYLQGLRSRLHGTRVNVTTIILGPVDTPMTASHPKNVLFAQPAEVAKAIVMAMDKGRGATFVPWFWRYIMLAVRNMPEAFFQRLKFLSGR